MLLAARRNAAWREQAARGVDIGDDARKILAVCDARNAKYAKSDTRDKLVKAAKRAVERIECPVEDCGRKFGRKYFSRHVCANGITVRVTCDDCGKTNSPSGMRVHTCVAEDGTKLFSDGTRVCLDCHLGFEQRGRFELNHGKTCSFAGKESRKMSRNVKGDSSETSEGHQIDLSSYPTAKSGFCCGAFQARLQKHLSSKCKQEVDASDEVKGTPMGQPLAPRSFDQLFVGIKRDIYFGTTSRLDGIKDCGLKKALKKGVSNWHCYAR